MLDIRRKTQFFFLESRSERHKKREIRVYVHESNRLNSLTISRTAMRLCCIFLYTWEPFCSLSPEYSINEIKISTPDPRDDHVKCPRRSHLKNKVPIEGTSELLLTGNDSTIKSTVLTYWCNMCINIQYCFYIYILQSFSFFILCAMF